MTSEAIEQALHEAGWYARADIASAVLDAIAHDIADHPQGAGADEPSSKNGRA